MRHILWVTAWVAAFGRFAPVAAAPGDTVATVTVHGRHNCLEVDTRKVGAPIRLARIMHHTAARTGRKPWGPGVSGGSGDSAVRGRITNIDRGMSS